MASSPPRFRPSVALAHHHRNNRPLLSLNKSNLASNIAHRGDRLREIRRAARSTNGLVRRRYADFIRDVGRNVYPVIVFTDYEEDGPSGVGSTLTLYREDGSVTKVSPALNSNYELYKTCGHLLMGLSVEVGPYLGNDALCRGDAAADDRDLEIDGDSEIEDNGGEINEGTSLLELKSSESRNLAGCADVPWKAGLTEFLREVRIFRQAFINAVNEDVVVEDLDRLSISSGDDGKERKSDSSSLALPPVEMQETMSAMFTSVIDFCESCLSTGLIDMGRWKRLNHDNFPRIKECMKAATKAQADACVVQIIEWRDMLGPEEWRDLYVVIPTVWAVDGQNPRKTMFRQLLDEDRVDSHIITTEWPRGQSEARTLLGRVVADRSIGRFIFGDETKEQRIKTMGLSSEVDVVQDDALPAIWDALDRHGCPVRNNRSSVAVTNSASAMSSGRMSNP